MLFPVFFVNGTMFTAFSNKLFNWIGNGSSHLNRQMLQDYVYPAKLNYSAFLQDGKYMALLVDDDLVSPQEFHHLLNRSFHSTVHYAKELPSFYYEKLQMFSSCAPQWLKQAKQCLHNCTFHCDKGVSKRSLVPAKLRSLHQIWKRETLPDVNGNTKAWTKLGRYVVMMSLINSWIGLINLLPSIGVQIAVGSTLLSVFGAISFVLLLFITIECISLISATPNVKTVPTQGTMVLKKVNSSETYNYTINR